MTEPKIPLVDLKRQYDSHEEEFDRALRSCLETTRFVGGASVERFEQQFAEHCGGGYVATCANGTDALYLAIMESLGPGDGQKEIITVSHTFIATVEAIVRAGYRPVFVDIDSDSYLMDLDRIEDAVTEDSAAIIPVHLYGQMVDMSRIVKLARRFNLRVIEDAAQAHGAERGGVRPGQLSDAACFSFYPGKNLGAWGDGGAVFTTDRDLASRIRKRADHGRALRNKYEHSLLGTNSRLDSIQAAILSVKLQYLDEWNDARRRVAGWYHERLADQPGVTVPTVVEGASHVYHLYVVSIEQRDEVLERLQARDIGASVHYPIPVHRQPACSDIGASFGELRVTESAARSVLSLPIFPELQREEATYIANTLVSAVVGS